MVCSDRPPVADGKVDCNGCGRSPSPGKESSDADDPNDHSIANPMVTLETVHRTEAIVRMRPLRPCAGEAYRCGLLPDAGMCERLGPAARLRRA